MKFLGHTGEYFEVGDLNIKNQDFINQSEEDQLTLIWIEEDGATLTIDAVDYALKANQIVCLTAFHKVTAKNIIKAKYLRFNAPFYCILNHDAEVGCKGLLFYGTARVPILDVAGEDLDVLKTVWKMLILEMQSVDNLQLEMLQMMLKRLLILTTRIYKSQHILPTEPVDQSDLVREFNYLVDKHFREKHTVAEYAALMYKSPKTISNNFKKLGQKSPLQYIQDRIMLEIRRLITL